MNVHSVSSPTPGFYLVGHWRPSTATGPVAVRSFAPAKQSQVRRRALEHTVDAIDVALIVVLGMAAWAVWLHGQVLATTLPEERGRDSYRSRTA